MTKRRYTLFNGAARVITGITPLMIGPPPKRGRWYITALTAVPRPPYEPNPSHARWIEPPDLGEVVGMVRQDGNACADLQISVRSLMDRYWRQHNVPPHANVAKAGAVIDFLAKELIERPRAEAVEVLAKAIDIARDSWAQYMSNDPAAMEQPLVLIGDTTVEFVRVETLGFGGDPKLFERINDPIELEVIVHTREHVGTFEDGVRVEDEPA